MNNPKGRGGWRGGGRPKGRTHTASIRVRCTPEQKQRIEAEAADFSAKSVSDFCLRKLLDF